MKNITNLNQKSNGSIENKGLGFSGKGMFGVARFTYDTASKDSLGVSNKTVAAHGTGVILPKNAVIVGGFVDVNTAFTTSASGTVAISVEGANDIITAGIVSSAPYSTIGTKAIVPKANTPESTSVKCTVDREIVCTVATGALTAGKLTGFLYYVLSDLSA
jgi:hypothetical protein